VTAPRLGDILIEQGIIDEEKLLAALSDQHAFGGKLGRTLVDLGYLSEEQLVHALASQLGLETVDLASVAVGRETLACLPVEACERYGVFPVRIDEEQRVLWVATAEPDLGTLQQVAHLTQRTIEPLLAPMSAIDRAVRLHYYGENRSRPRLGDPLPGIPRDPGAPRRAGLAAAAALADAPELVEGAVAPGAVPTGSSELAELRGLVLQLERALSAQGRAFRALVEILQDKGVVRRGELGQHTTREREPGS
jgi:type IV pilus assembly protein PilB